MTEAAIDERYLLDVWDRVTDMSSDQIERIVRPKGADALLQRVQMIATEVMTFLFFPDVMIPALVMGWIVAFGVVAAQEGREDESIWDDLSKLLLLECARYGDFSFTCRTYSVTWSQWDSRQQVDGRKKPKFARSLTGNLAGDRRGRRPLFQTANWIAKRA